jgi:hypothetical protein
MKKATDFKNQWLSNWWAHQDLNLGPKDIYHFWLKQ